MPRAGRILSLVFFTIAQLALTAELIVSDLEIATVGSCHEDTFQLSSIGSAELAIQGGYKFGGTLRFAFSSSDIEKTLQYANNPPEKLGDSDSLDKGAYNQLVDRFRYLSSLSFQLARVSVRQPFDWPISLDYFIGTTAVLCSGDEISQRFGLTSPASTFRGYSYYPEGINGNPAFQFNGIHAISGSGLALTLGNSTSLVPIIYLYQDAALASSSADDIIRGLYSTDFRLFVNDQRFQAELFAGATFPYGLYGRYRGGLLFYTAVGSGVEFMGQIGVTAWAPGESFSQDNFYVLIEPRLNLGFTSIIFSLFHQPCYYLQKDIGAVGAYDINVKVLLGNLQETGMEGGAEITTFIRKPSADNDSFTLLLSPFFGLVTEGVRWDFKLMINPTSVLNNPYRLVETYIGIRTAY